MYRNLFFPRSVLILLSLSLFSLGFFSNHAGAQDDAAERQPLLTRWAKEVSPTAPWPEYPRPQLVRKHWHNLNGAWDFAITQSESDQPNSYSEKILVPFPIESHLSQVTRSLAPTQRAWYRRTFTLPTEWRDDRVLLHFGAVDWHAEVWINGKRVGEHYGGYDPFTFDITDSLQRGGENEVVVAVSDPTDAGTQPRGKQVLKPEGIWYTPVSGIWQTVWLEPVPQSYVRRLRAEPDLANSSVTIHLDAVDAPTDAIVEVVIQSEGKTVASSEVQVGNAVTIDIDDVRPWSPDDPFLYDLEVRLRDGNKTLDTVTSYFGMRSIELGHDHNGLVRMLFNGEPLFQFGPLDQGYWPDGLYTAPTDEAMRYDLDVTKRLGFNMVRKHVKVEPARWYYWCDKLGLIVWQDMPSGDRSAPWPADGLEIERTAESAAGYRRELEAMIDNFRQFTCIVVWVPFNEAWGQFDTVRVTDWLKEYDPTRLVISASGGNDFGTGDIKDDHFYPGPGAPPAEKSRAAVLGEFGGLGLPMRGHTWQDEKNWGYRSFETPEQLTAAYQDVVAKLRPLIESHLSAAVYTQTTDVEVEVNGLLTYDREILKPDEDAVRAVNLPLYKPLPNRTAAENVSASVLAWWRFDNGTTGTVSDLKEQMGAIAARDFSGHNNHLYAFSAASAPAISERVPNRSFGLIKPENNHSLDDSAEPGKGAPSRDLYTNSDVSRTHMDTVERFPFSDFTIEASFCLTSETSEQAVLSKEQDVDGALHPLFQLGVFGDDATIGVELLDHAGELVKIQSDVQAGAGQWWHVVVTCRDGKVRLYIADDNGGQFELAGEAEIANSLALKGGTWLVGRGCQEGKMGRDFRGWIDEIRISTKALDESQFLFGSETNETGDN